MIDCGAGFETASGETVSPCDLPLGHIGAHKGYVLGSRCSWDQGVESEWDVPGVCTECDEYGVWRTLDDGRTVCEGCLVAICNNLLRAKPATQEILDVFAHVRNGRPSHHLYVDCCQNRHVITAATIDAFVAEHI